MFWFSGREARGILAPQPGIEPAPPALEGEVLTTGPPGKARCFSVLFFKKKKTSFKLSGKCSKHTQQMGKHSFKKIYCFSV